MPGVVLTFRIRQPRGRRDRPRPGDSGQTEIQYLHAPIRREEYIFGLDVTMDDALGMGHGKRLRDGQANLTGFAPRNSRLTQTLTDGLSLQQLHHGEAHALGVANIVNRQDVGMRQRRDGLGFALETQQRVGVLGELFRENLDGYIALQAEVARAVDFTHASGANRGKNFIRAEASTGRENHGFANLARIR